MLPQMLMLVSQGFVDAPVVGCLTCLTQAVELYGGDEDEQVEAVLSTVLGSLVQSVIGWLKTAADPEAQPELLTAFWEMCHRSLAIHPRILLKLRCSACWPRKPPLATHRAVPVPGHGFALALAFASHPSSFV